MMNKSKKPKISYSLISIVILILVAFITGSYIFYSKSKPIEAVTKVRINDYQSIDSIKNIAVKDTVSYLNKIVTKMQSDLSKKDSMIRTLSAASLIDRKKYDSLDSKLYLSQRRYRAVKDSIKK